MTFTRSLQGLYRPTTLLMLRLSSGIKKSYYNETLAPTLLILTPTLLTLVPTLLTLTPTLLT